MSFSKRKYIVVLTDAKVSEYGPSDPKDIELIFTFPHHLTHKVFAETIRAYGSRDRHTPEEVRAAMSMGTVIAGGFVYPDGVCYGKSESLGVVSRGEVDTKLLRNS